MAVELGRRSIAPEERSIALTIEFANRDDLAQNESYQASGIVISVHIHDCACSFKGYRSIATYRFTMTMASLRCVLATSKMYVGKYFLSLRHALVS